MIQEAPSYAPICGFDRNHKMVFCDNCGPENVWCLDCHNKMCGSCYEQLDQGIWMYRFSDTFVFEGCERDKSCKLEKPEGLCEPCQKASKNLDEV